MEPQCCFILGLVTMLPRDDNSSGLCALFTFFTSPHLGIFHIMASIATLSSQSKVQNQVLTETGPYGATLRNGIIPEPITPTKGQVSVITVTESNIEIRGNTAKSVMGKSVHNLGIIKFAKASKASKATSDDTDDDAKPDAKSDTKPDAVEEGPEPVPNVAPNADVDTCVIGCTVITKGITFG